MSNAGRKSKLDPFEDLIGTVPDREVARRAGVTPENVRSFRIRRGVPASWRGETAAELASRLQSKAEELKPRASRVPRSRPSKLDPFREHLGEMPDKEIAVMAGVSAENVRSYRLRRGIPAKWRGEGDLPRTFAGPYRAALAGLDPCAEQRAYRVIADVAGTQREYVTFGTDMSGAAQGARERLSRLHPGAVLREICLIGSAL